MAYTYLLNDTPEQKRIARVRKEIDDRTDEPADRVRGVNYFQSNEDILDALASAEEELPDDANEVEVRLSACAALLDTLATNQAYVLKVGRTLGEEKDGAKVADSIRAHAKNLRARVTASLSDRRKQTTDAAVAAQEIPAPCNRTLRLVPRLF